MISEDGVRNVEMIHPAVKEGAGDELVGEGSRDHPSQDADGQRRSGQRPRAQAYPGKPNHRLQEGFGRHKV